MPSRSRICKLGGFRANICTNRFKNSRFILLSPEDSIRPSAFMLVFNFLFFWGGGYFLFVFGYFGVGFVVGVWYVIFDGGWWLSVVGSAWEYLSILRYTWEYLGVVGCTFRFIIFDGGG